MARIRASLAASAARTSSSDRGQEGRRWLRAPVTRRLAERGHPAVAVAAWWA